MSEGKFLYQNYLTIKKEKDLTPVEFADLIGVSKSKLYKLFGDERIEYKYKERIIKKLNLIFPPTQDKEEIAFEENKLEFDFKELKIKYTSVLEENKVMKEKEVIYLNEIERLRNK